MPGSLFKKIKFLLLLLILAGTVSRAQLGFKLSYANPVGDFGAVYKKAPAYDLYYYQTYDNPKVASRAGIYYTSLKPRLDSFPVAYINTTSDHIAIPGAVVYKNFSLIALYIEHSLRIAHFNKFSAWAGLGLTIGSMHQQWNEYYLAGNNPGLSGSTDITDYIGGFRSRVALNYRPGDHLSVYLEAMNLALTDTEWSGFYTHNNFSLGINFFFHAEDNNECDDR